MTSDLTKPVIADILSLFGIPSDSMQTLWNTHCEKKLNASRDILFEEIEQGILANMADDDKISLIHRYAQAAMNGSARINLRLLAKAINSIANGEKLAKPIYANKFNRYAQILETLSEEEIHLLASMYQYRKEATPPHTTVTPTEIIYENEFVEKFAYHYQYKNGIAYTQYLSLCSALLRTGLIYQTGVGALDTIKYALSPLFDEIVELVDFQDALNKETQR